MLKSGMSLDVMPPAFKSLLQQVAPEAMQKKFEQSGMKTDLYKQFADAGLIDKGDLNATRKEKFEKQAEFEVKVTLNESRVASMIKDVLKGFASELVNTVRVSMKKEVEATQRGQEVQAASNH